MTYHNEAARFLDLLERLEKLLIGYLKYHFGNERVERWREGDE